MNVETIQTKIKTAEIKDVEADFSCLPVWSQNNIFVVKVAVTSCFLFYYYFFNVLKCH